MTLMLRVYGIPAAQGSKRGFVRGGKVVMVEMSDRLRPWREAVWSAVRTACPHGVDVLNEPVRVRGVFLFPRPKSHYRTVGGETVLKEDAPKWVAKTPDIDKIWRATLDPLTQINVFRDDALVVDLAGVKVFAGEGELPGAHLEIGRAL